MSAVIVNEVRRGFYLDSVALMRLSADLTAQGGVEEAVLMIGTPANMQIMRDAGVLADDGASAGPNDLVIALRADSERSANRALAHARKSLQGGALRSASSAAAPRTLAAAIDALPDANLALISTPGAFATREARAALRRDLNVMIFSDNVPVEDEVALKQLAQERGLLVMGPDCGTAWINGTPLAFANAINSGGTAAIAASGTGLQEFAVLLSRFGGGLRHGIGVGGRDLGDAVGGLSTLRAIDLLSADDEVEQIVLISKPPGAETAKHIFSRLATCGKPALACVFGLEPSSLPAEVSYAATLLEAAQLACGKSADVPDNAALAGELAAGIDRSRKRLCGLFTGGTLCTEAQLVLSRNGVPNTSNAQAPGGESGGAGHLLLDLGADEYTIGRPHPMIEPAVRTPQLASALSNPENAVVLIDLVLGFGAHPDPAESVASAIAEAGTERPVVIGSVCGSSMDPQNFDNQCQQLREVGVVLCQSNAEAALLAAKVMLALPR